MDSLQAISAHIPPAMLVMFRIGGLMIYGPVFGSPVVPVRVKVLLTLVLGLAVYPLVSGRITPQPPLELELWSLAPLVAMELAFGLAIGLLASIPLVAAQAGGLTMSQQMGLGFASIFNPTMDTESESIGQLLFFLTLAGFLIVGGHEWMLLAVLNSFEHVPLGGFRADGDFVVLLTGLLTAAFEVALRVAAPLLAIIFLESLALGFIAKTVPQLNILSLGFPVRILVGIGVIAVGLTIVNEVLMDFLNETLTLMEQWSDAAAARPS